MIKSPLFLCLVSLLGKSIPPSHAQHKLPEIKDSTSSSKEAGMVYMIRDDSLEKVDLINISGFPKSRVSDITVIHSIPFNGEPMVLLTLAYLYDVVDLFVVVEALETFSGSSKGFYHLDRQSTLLKPYRDKILQVRIDRFPVETFDIKACGKRGDCAECWCREGYIRDIIKETVRQHFGRAENSRRESKYVLIHADGDELPKKHLVKNLPLLYDTINSWGGRANVQTTKFVYSFKWFSQHSYHRSVFILTDHFFANNPNITMEAIRHSKSSDIRHIFIRSAWHCTSCLSVDDLITKIESFSHQEINTADAKNRTKLLQYINSGKDMLERHTQTRAYLATPYAGQEGFPSLAECPQCGEVPGYFDILGLDVVANRANKNGYSPHSSNGFDKALDHYMKRIQKETTTKKPLTWERQTQDLVARKEVPPTIAHNEHPRGTSTSSQRAQGRKQARGESRAASIARAHSSTKPGKASRIRQT